MVYVKIEGHDFKYQVEDIIKLFYREEISYIETEPPEAIRGIFILSRINEVPGDVMLVTELRVDGVLQGREDGMPAGELEEAADDYSRKKILKRHVKRQIYLLLSRYTGNILPWGILTGIRPAKIVYELLQEGQARENIIKKLKEYYRLPAKKAGLLYDVAAAEYGILEGTPPDTISLYVGIPFCPSRCLYCSFTSEPVSKYASSVGRYIDTLETEMDYAAELIKRKGLVVRSIYIGGGTPTSISAGELERLLSILEKKLNMDCLEEYTLEAGRPDSIDAAKLSAIKGSRVDRISINPQTMNDAILRTIGRSHDSREVERAYFAARDMGFDNINMDVIVGLPGESADMFCKSLERIKALGPESLTVHTMAVKRASRLSADIERFEMVSESEASRMVDMAGSYAESMGMRPYYLYRQKNMLGNLENIGYSKPGYESIYNIQIMEEKQTIIALGAGAITKAVFPQENRIERAFNVKNIEEYMSRIDEMIQRKKNILE